MRPLPRGPKLLYIAGEKNVEPLRYHRSALYARPTLISVGRKVQKFGGFGAGAGPQWGRSGALCSGNHASGRREACSAEKARVP